MRVISGKFKSRKLIAPKGLNTRPTLDNIKETIFNIISPITINAKVLDLFSGTGQIGIEFYSRGAKEVYLVDSSHEAISVINKNLESLKLDDEINVMKMDAMRALKGPLKEKKFDYIFLDPPYKKHELLNEVLKLIISHDLIDEGGIIIIEENKDYDLEEIISTDDFDIDIRTIGDKKIFFIRGVKWKQFTQVALTL